MQGDDETEMARRRRWAGAALAGVLAYVMGQAFAYSPIKVDSEEELHSAMMSPLGISNPATGR